MRTTFVLSALSLAAIAGTAIADDLHVALNYNFNGMVHPTESGLPDSFEPSWFRSIADRGLAIDNTSGALTTSFGFNPIVGATGLTYSIVTEPGVLDIVMLGNRSINAAWDTVVPGADVNRGIRPDWLPDDNQRGPQTTTLAEPVVMDQYAEIGVLYHITNVGGPPNVSTFRATLNFSDATSVTVIITGRDWFGSRPAIAPAANSGLSSQSQLGVYKGTNNRDSGTISEDAGQALNVWEAVIDARKLLSAGLGDINGKTLTSITYQYPEAIPTGNRNYAIFATTVRTGTQSAANSTCETATPVTAANVATPGTNVRAIASTGAGCGTADSAGVWYSYTATSNANLMVTTCGSALDTTVAVYDGCGGTLIGCSDNACGSGSLVQWAGQTGHSYKIRIAGNNNAEGNFSFTLTDPAPNYQPVALNYNFNGIVHGAAEQGQANYDNPNGYRSIADRGIILGSGEVDSIDRTPLIDSEGMPFSLVADAGELDIVHLGDRNLVANGARVYGSTLNNAPQPSWQADSTDDTDPQTTDLSAARYVLGAGSRLGVIYQVTDAGGTFDTTLNFTDSTSVTVTMRAPDWFNSQTVPAPGAASGLIAQRQLGVYAATENTDMATIATNNLNVVEAVTSVAELINDGLGDHTGKQIASLVFSNPISNANYPNTGPAARSGYAIFAATLRDVTIAPPACPADIGIAGGLPGQDGMLDNNDFIAFINYFFAQDPIADMGIAGGLPGSDSLWDNNDFIAFISHFFNGCGN